MRIEPFAYMAWAKAHGGRRYRLNLADSGTRSVLTEELGLRLDDVKLNGPDHYGPPELMSRLAKFLGVGVENLVRASGTSLANFLAFGVLLGPGDEALVESPCYEALRGLPQLFGATARLVPRGARFALDPDAVLRAVGPKTRLVALSNLHNPSGAALDDAALAALAREAERRDFHVVVDEVYQDFLPGGRMPAAMRRPGARVLAPRSF